MKATFNFVNGDNIELLDLDQNALEALKKIESDSIITGDKCMINLRNVTCIIITED